MDGIHDLGGKQGFGPVLEGAVGTPHLPTSTPHSNPHSVELAFGERWQGAVYHIINTLLRHGIAQNVDHFRHAVERIDPVCYLTDGYYGRWLGAAENLLVEANNLTQEQINERVCALGGELTSRIAARPHTSYVLEPSPTGTNADDENGRGGNGLAGTAQRAIKPAPKFSIGDHVITDSHGRAGHTRLPAYARGCMGTVVDIHGAWVYPDTHAHGGGEQPQHLYTVAFDGETLWGDGAEPGTQISIDLFEPYLEKSTSAAP